MKNFLLWFVGCFILFCIGLSINNKNDQKRYEAASMQPVTERHAERNVTNIVPCRTEDNIPYINVSVGGVTLEFILDTGCTDMSISRSDLQFFKRAGVVSNADYNGTITCSNADGRDNVCDVYNIRKITIGNRTIRNVRCFVARTDDCPRLLGNSIIRQLGSVHVDYKRNTVTFN